MKQGAKELQGVPRPRQLVYSTFCLLAFGVCVMCSLVCQGLGGEKTKKHVWCASAYVLQLYMI